MNLPWKPETIKVEILVEIRLLKSKFLLNYDHSNLGFKWTITINFHNLASAARPYRIARLPGFNPLETSWLWSCALLSFNCYNCREIVTLADGGQIILDWYENENTIFPDKETRPTILLLPGLTGNFK